MKKKLCVFVMTFLFGLSLIPQNVYAEADSNKYGTVSDISKSDSVKSGTGDSLDVEIIGNTEKNVTVNYGKNKGITLQYLPGNDEGRDDNAAWLGFHITNPTSIQKQDAKVSINGNAEQKIEDDGNYYFGITKENLNKAAANGKPLTYTYVFKWSSDNTQTITINIYPKAITLLEKQENGGKQLWTYDDVPKTAYKDPIIFISIIMLMLIIGSYSLTKIHEK